MEETATALQHAERANQLAADNAYADRRPWLAIKSIAVEALAQGVSTIWRLRAEIENYGRTAFIGGNVYFQAFRVGSDEIRPFLLEGVGGSVSAPLSSFVPGEIREVETYLHLDIEEVLPPYHGAFWLGVAALYRSADGRNHKIAQSWTVGEHIQNGIMQSFNREHFIAGQYAILSTMPTLTYLID